MTRIRPSRVRVRLWPVSIAAVVGLQHYDFTALFVDAIPHPVLTAPGPPQAVERRSRGRVGSVAGRQRGRPVQLVTSAVVNRAHPIEPKMIT